MNIIREAISYGRTILSPLEVEILLAFVLRTTREYLLTYPENKLSDAEISQFRFFIEKRSCGIPIAHLTHHKEFFGLDFYVDERVFIPRPETELLVEEAIKLYSPMSGYICDVGTGSGCIAIAIAKHFPAAKIFALDISEAALEVARKNAERHSVYSQIEFVKSDLLAEISEHYFDGIVTNLPYIGTIEHNLVSKEVLEHEPHTALFSGHTGLELYERLFSQIRALPKPPKWVIGEIGFLQCEAIEKLIRQYFGNISLNFKNDLSGFPRMFSIIF